MVEIHWTLSAMEAVKNIAEYIAGNSVYFAEKQVQKFYEAVEDFISASPIRQACS